MGMKKNGYNLSIEGIVSIAILIVIGFVGFQLIVGIGSSSQEVSFSNTQTDDFTGSGTLFVNTTATGGSVQLVGTNDTGTYEQTTNTLDQTYNNLQVTASVPSGDSLNVTFSSPGSTDEFEVSDGDNTFTLSGHSGDTTTITYEFVNGSANGQNPQLEAYTVNGTIRGTSSLLITIMGTFFLIALLVLVLRRFNVNLGG